MTNGEILDQLLAEAEKNDMSDLVKRLRESAKEWAREVETRIEAADEIEQLRAELDDINVADLQAEIEVLKESLHAAYLVGHHNALEKDEALLRQALDALDNHGSPWLGHDLVYLAAMDALKDRLK